MKRIFTSFTAAFFYCNFFIACCAASLIYESLFLLNLLSGTNWFVLLAFFCTVNIYCLHYYIKSLKSAEDERLNWYHNHRQWIFIILLAGTTVILYLLFNHLAVLFSDSNFVWSLLIPVLSIAYSFPFLPGGKSLRHFGWLKLPLLSFVWSFVTVWLPVFYSGANTINQTQIWVLFANRFFFIMALAMLFNIRDYEEDKRDNIKTPAVVFGRKKILIAGKWIMTAVNIITAVLLIRFFHFHTLMQYVAMLLPVILLFLLFHFFKKHENEIRFSVLHDGLMPVKALLLIFAIL